ncbi:MAG TPA: aminopeptidase [Xanthomonadales bacterium]|nr:aminopeptidase [Xanthomonadales bacterium]
MKDRQKSLLMAASIIAGMLLSLLFIASCSTASYYHQAISGHLSLMHQRQDIDKLMADPQTNPGLATQLQLAQDILGYAERNLQLDAHGSYRQVVITGQPAVSWNVVAAAEFSVDPKTWCFPVAGCVPYRGYFKQHKAEEYAHTLQEQGFDVDVSPVTAYSTLGWFDDPLLDTMFQYSPAQLAGVLIHELAHQKLYVAGDTAFNESFAEFVESLGVEQWLQQTERLQELQDWNLRRQAEPQFNALLSGGRESLRQLYASGLDTSAMREQKQAALRAMKAEYQRMVSEEWQGRDYFGGWMAGELNNARLALANSYNGGACAFAALYQQAGGQLDGFYELAEIKAKLSPEQREAWLQAPCEPHQ